MICSITQLLRVFGSSQELFRTIDAASLRRKKSGELWYCVGGSGVIFNLEEDGRRYLLKCYTSKSRYCRAIYGDKLLEDELYIPSEHGGLWLDVVVDSWREGSTLTAAIEDAVAADNRDKLQLLSQRFDRLALELLSAEWAHGDITCDNIIVSDSLELHLIDFDGSFLPCFAGRRSLEIGTQAFQHPLRDEEHFDRTIDDYSLALISTALAHLAFEPSIYPDFGSRDALLYDPAEAVEGRCELLHHALRSFAQRGDLFAYAVGGLLQSRSVELPELYPLLRYKVEGLHEAAKPT